MLFYLIVAEFKHLQPIIKGSLGCPGFCKVVHYFLVGEGLLDIVVVEIDDRVAVLERLPAHSVIKYDFFLAGGVDALNLAIAANVLLDYFLGGVRFSVVFLWEFKTKVLLLFLCDLLRLFFFINLLLYSVLLLLFLIRLLVLRCVFLLLLFIVFLLLLILLVHMHLLEVILLNIVVFFHLLHLFLGRLPFF